MTTATERGFQLIKAAPGTLGVSGVLSFDTAAAALPAIHAALAEGAANQLDLSGVSRSDSAGLACVLAVAARAARDGQALQVIHMPADMQALAQVCEVDTLLH
ncbi:MAG TPA: STAS domain-containing protein [Rhodanobacter sp.]